MDNIEDLIKRGPPVNYVAGKLGISRQTFYRQMKQYQQEAYDKVNPSMKAYLDQLREGKISSIEEAKKYLENTQQMNLAEQENKREELDEMRHRISRDKMILMQAREHMSEADYRKELENLRKREEELSDMRRNAGENFFRRRRSYSMRPASWIGEGVRSCVIGSGFDLAIVVDCPFRDVSNYGIELLMKIDEEFYPVTRISNNVSSKIFGLGNLQRGVEYAYRIYYLKEDALEFTDTRELPVDDF